MQLLQADCTVYYYFSKFGALFLCPCGLGDTQTLHGIISSPYLGLEIVPGSPKISGFQALLGSAFAVRCEPVLSLLCLKNFSIACFCVFCPASQLCHFLLFLIVLYINDEDLLSVHKSWQSFPSVVSSSIFCVIQGHKCISVLAKFVEAFLYFCGFSFLFVLFILLYEDCCHSIVVDQSL